MLTCCLGCAPGAAAPAGLTVAEYFRDVEGQDVLLFVDNIFRFTQVTAPLCWHAWGTRVCLQAMCWHRHVIYALSSPTGVLRLL